MFALGDKRWPGLSKLIEEAGEVVQVSGKLIAIGGEANHWDGSDLRVRLTEELADLQAAIDMVVYLNRLNKAVLTARREAKRALFVQWHIEQGEDDTDELEGKT